VSGSSVSGFRRLDAAQLVDHFAEPLSAALLVGQFALLVSPLTAVAMMASRSIIDAAYQVF
jgi:hypothetical protein